MSAPSWLGLVFVLALLVLSGASQTRPGTFATTCRERIIPAVVLGAIMLATFYFSEFVPSALIGYVSANPWTSTLCTILAAITVTSLTIWRIRKLALTDVSGRYWGSFEIALCCMFAINMFLIALPEIRFLWGTISLPGATSDVFKFNFQLYYSDTQKIVFNPIYDLLRCLLVWYTPEYFLLAVSCVYLMALAIAFFCAGTSPMIGYYGSIALAAGLCWSKEVLLSVLMVTNLVTLFLTAGLSVWVLSQSWRAVAPDATRLRIVSTGLLIGAVGTVSLYAYVASRGICVALLVPATLLLAWGAARRSPHRVYYLTALFSIVIVPGTVLLSQYYGRWASFVSDLRAGVPSIESLHHGRPSFVDPNIEASTPDLPAYYGALITDVPQDDGSVKREWVYWLRSPAETAWVIWSNFCKVLKRYLPFPGGKAAWFFALIGMLSWMAMASSRRKAALYAGVCFAFALILFAPFLVIPSAGDWRRGVAIILVFAPLTGLGVYRLVELCFPTARKGVVLVAASILVFVVCGRPGIDTITATPIGHLGNLMVCKFNPLRILFVEIRKDPQMNGKVLIVGSRQERCIYAVSRQLDSMLGGNRVSLVEPSEYDFAKVKARLTSGDSVIFVCGENTGAAEPQFCAEIRSSPEARLLYSAPADVDEIWAVTKH